MPGTSNHDITAELRPFFYPRSIAVVGVSRDPARIGNRMIRALQEYGFQGAIYPINPHLKEILGQPVYPSITAIPGEIDLACVYIAAANVLDVVRECRQKNIPAIHLFAGGFSETGTDEGRRLEAELASLAGNGMRIIGPNCFGVYSPDGRIPLVAGPENQLGSGSMGFFAQSGGNAEDVYRYAVDSGLKFSQGISYGNACDVNETDLLSYFEVDPNTSVVAAYIEGIKKGREFFKTIQRLTRKKPFIIFKGGLSPHGSRVAASHTGSLSGSDRVWTALFQQTNAVQVNSVWELLDTASAFCHLPPQADPRVAMIGGGGGIGVTFSDACYHEGLALPELSQEVRQKIASLLDPIGTSANNPIDLGPPYPSVKLLENVLEIVASSGEVGNIVLDKISPSYKIRQAMGYPVNIESKDDAELTEIPIKIAKKWKFPIIVILREGGNKPGDLSYEAERQRLRNYYLEQGVGVYPTAERALKSLGRMIHYYQKR